MSGLGFGQRVCQIAQAVEIEIGHESSHPMPERGLRIAAADQLSRKRVERGNVAQGEPLIEPPRNR